MTPRTVAQVGVRGFGRVHLERIDRLAASGRVSLVATADPGGPLPDQPADWHPGLDELLAHHSPDIVSIATPIGTHLPLSLTALQAGAHVLLEKPPVASLGEFWTLLRAQKQTGRVVQVGFQSLGSTGIARLRELMSDGTLGEIIGINAHGSWVRDKAYYARSPWAGLRRFDGRRVADGVVTNPLAHSIATALAVAGVTRLDDIASVTTELYHAHDIEADDTSFVRIDLTDRPPVCAALTLCAETLLPPTIHVVGTRGVADYAYTLDELTLTVDGRTTHEQHERVCLLENLIDHLDGASDLLVPLADSVGFLCVLEATQDRPDPLPIDPTHVTWFGEGAEAHPVVDGIAGWLDRALAEQRGFAAVGAPWANPDAVHVWRPRTNLAQLRIGNALVAEYADGSDIIPTSSPRPYLHPIRTLSGVIVSDTHPADHDWHCGLSFTMQDVNGVNFWGGRTYVRDRGYTWRGDQGAITHVDWLEQGEGRLVQRLRWAGPVVAPGEAGIDPVELVETRTLTWWAADEHTWVLDADLALASPTGARVLLGGPGTNGRDVGYGGWQLRLRPSDDVRVFGPGLEGVDAVFGQASDWVAWRARFEGCPVTLVMAHLDADGAASDRWFVRHDEYDTLGVALAWSNVVEVPLRRRYRLVVADGELDVAAIAALT